MLFIKLLVTLFIVCALLFAVLETISKAFKLDNYSLLECVILLCAVIAIGTGVLLVGLMFGHILFLMWTT